MHSRQGTRPVDGRIRFGAAGAKTRQWPAASGFAVHVGDDRCILFDTLREKAMCRFASRLFGPRSAGIRRYICSLLFKQDRALLPVRTPRRLAVIDCLRPPAARVLRVQL